MIAQGEPRGHGYVKGAKVYPSPLVLRFFELSGQVRALHESMVLLVSQLNSENQELRSRLGEESESEPEEVFKKIVE